MRSRDSLSLIPKILFFVFKKYDLHTWHELIADMSSKMATSSPNHPRGLQTRKGEKDGVQNRPIETMGCKITQSEKDKGEKCN